MPVDMAGFAIHVDEILRNNDVVMGKTSNGSNCTMLETCFLEQFTTRETAECSGGKRVRTCMQILPRFNYNRKIWWGIKFGSLAICLCNSQIKISATSGFAYARMAINPLPNRHILNLPIVLQCPSAKFNPHQYLFSAIQYI